MIKISQTLSENTVFKYIDEIKKNNIFIELMLNADFLDLLANKSEFEKLYRIVNSKLISIHAVSNSLNIGSKDKTIREYSLNRILEGIQLACKLNVKEYIFHSTYFPFLSKEEKIKWLNNAFDSLDKIIDVCNKKNIFPIIENTYEKDFELFEIIFEKYNELFFCIDIGHINCFADKDYEKWFEKFKKRLKVIHFHNNDGSQDSHCDLNNGIIDYNNLKNFLKYIDNVRFNLETLPDNMNQNIIILKSILKE